MSANIFEQNHNIKHCLIGNKLSYALLYLLRNKILILRLPKFNKSAVYFIFCERGFMHAFEKKLKR